MLTVHFVGMPPGTADILFKFVRPETLERFGGPEKFAQAVDSAVTEAGDAAPRARAHPDPAVRRRVRTWGAPGAPKPGARRSGAAVARPRCDAIPGSTLRLTSTETPSCSIS